MLKLTNRLVQWLQSIQKPLSGLFRHLYRSKNEEDLKKLENLLQVNVMCLKKKDQFVTHKLKGLLMQITHRQQHNH